MTTKTKTKLVPVPSPNMIPDRDIDKRPILECINLGITFGGLKAVEDFNLAIGRTEIAGLIGPNGAGKTTVFNLLTKVYQPTRGTILLDGNDTHDMDTIHVSRAGIARTFQNIRLFQNLSVEDNRAFSACPATGSRNAPPMSGRWSCCPSSTWQTWPASRPAPCPTAPSAAWRSSGPWPPIPRCCCWTNRRRA